MGGGPRAIAEQDSAEGRLRPWTEWKQKCALGLCSASSRAALRGFAVSRFRVYARRYISLTNVSNVNTLIPDPEQAWHLFETHMTVGNAPSGKRYKDWLFVRAEGSDDDPVDVIQGGATLIMREVVREYLRQEFPPKNTISIQSPVPGVCNQSLTVEDLLPGDVNPASEVEVRELEALAERQAEEVFVSLTRRERIVLLAKELDLSLAHPEVRRSARCRKSRLSELYQRVTVRIMRAFEAAFPNDDRATVLTLTFMCVREAMRAAREWGQTQRSFARFFELTAGS